MISICGRSDSIWEKSGLSVKSAVRFDVMPYLTLTPPSGCALSVTKAPFDVSSEPSWMPVATGMISRLRLIERFVMPSSSPIWGRKPDTPREIGAQTAFSSFCRISRTIWNAQRCGTSRPRCG